MNSRSEVSVKPKKQKARNINPGVLLHASLFLAQADMEDQLGNAVEFTLLLYGVPHLIVAPLFIQ